MKARKLFLLVIVLIEWFALVAQLVLQLNQTNLAERAELLIRFFTYFTITTNILVAVCCTNQLLSRGNRRAGFFFSSSVQTAIAMYITVVGLVYNLILRQLWTPTGLQAILDDLLHTVFPILFIIYWFIWVNAHSLRYKNILPWLIYPAVYAIVVIVRGYFAGWYPYPFLDVPRLGALQVAINSGALVLVFMVLSYLFVFFGKRKSF